jgi:tetrahydromethanopterin S-methyltransferase subunit B
MKVVKVEDDLNLVRDVETGAILFNNTAQYQNYVQQRIKLLARNEQIEQQKEEINSMKNDISEIKGMLTALLNRNQ